MNSAIRLGDGSSAMMTSLQRAVSGTNLTDDSAPPKPIETEENPMTQWESLAGSLAGSPAVTTWTENEMQVFAIGPDGELSSIYWDGRAWHPWHGHGGSFVGSPAACSWGADRIDVFARTANGTLMHQWYDPAGWSAWESLGVAVAGDVAACSWGPGRIDLFAPDPGGALVHGWWDGTAWSFEG